MAYGIDLALFIEDGPTIHSEIAAAARRSGRFRRWSKLDSDRRLKVVETALRAPANDPIDDFPIAL